MANPKKPGVVPGAGIQRTGSAAKVKAQQTEQMDQGLAVKYDGKTYTVRMGDLSALDAQALRREVGMSFLGVMRAMAPVSMGGTGDPDIDLIAAIVWLARRTNGEQMLAYADVASEFGYDADIEVVEPEDDDDPEA